MCRLLSLGLSAGFFFIMKDRLDALRSMVRKVLSAFKALLASNAMKYTMVECLLVVQQEKDELFP